MTVTATAPIEAPAGGTEPATARPTDERRPITGAPAADAVLARARATQEAWGALPVAERVATLRALPRVLGDAIDRIADQIHEENGKPRAEAVGHEAAAAVQLARHHVDAAARVLGTDGVGLPYLPHRRATVHHRPYGVVLAIAPWNIPFLIPLSQVLPALLAGNAVILKPSEHTPRTAELLAELFAAAGLDDGLLQVVTGDGTAGSALLAARPDKVLFTGSVATGRNVMAAAAQIPAPVSLELGGVDAMIVRADADLEFTASALAWGATFNGGQACCSVERLLVHESIAEPLLARTADKLRRIDVSRDLAPAIDERQQRVWLEHVADARDRGATIRSGGSALPGRRLEPTLISGAAVPEADVWTQETFGPIVAAVTFGDDDEAVRLHNASPYGLTASVFTADTDRGRAMAGHLHAGVVAVNEVAATLYSAPELPWGGVGRSGFGRSHGEDALREAGWTQVIEEPRGYAFGPKRPWWYPYGGSLERLLGDVGRAFAHDRVAVRAFALARAGAGLLPLLSRFPKL